MLGQPSVQQADKPYESRWVGERCMGNALSMLGFSFLTHLVERTVP